MLMREARAGTSALVVTLFVGLAPGAFAYDFQKSITIDRTKISDASCGTTLSSYPMLFSVTDPDLAHTTSGGDVTDLGGDDILFVGRDAATCGGPSSCILAHEIERYVNTTGELVAWVRVPSVNTNATGSDTVIYVYYGDSTVTTPTENPPGVWDASFKGVWHLKEGTGVTAADSTANNNSAVPNSGNPTSNTGQIGRALRFASPSRLRIAAAASLELTSTATPNWTMSAWVQPTSYTTNWPTIYSYGSYRASMGLSQIEAGTNGRIENWTNDVDVRHSTSAVPLGTWHYVTITRTAATTSFYIDGSANGSASPSPTPTLANQVSGIGSDGNGAMDTTEQFLGLIDEVRVANVARSACWIDAEYDNQFDPGDVGAPGFYTVGATTTAYDFRKRITIDRGQISDLSCGATLTNFPMLFNSVDPDLRHTSNGGDVTDLGGDDIIFQAFDTTTCGGPTSCTLDHEIERYDNTTGELVAWVRLPSVNTAVAASDTIIYVTYGNGTVTSPTENPNGVWDGNYQGVWHLHEGDSTAAGFYRDSTINNEHGTLTDANGNSTAAAGQIGGAYDFNGDADRIDVPNFSQYLTTAMTISGWVRPPAPHTDHDGYFGIRNGDVDHSFYVLQLANTSDLEFRFRNSVGGVHDANVVSAVSAGAWVYVALTYDGSDLISYVDGQFANQDPTATGSFSSSAYSFSMGAVGGNPLDGTVDEVRVSDTARTACWIGAEYNNQAWPDKAVTPAPLPPSPTEGFYGVGAPTAVELVSFTAHGLDGGVELAWETGSELDNLGFHLYRSLSASGPWERITASLIPGLGSSPAGARYGYRDTGLENGVTYFYELEDIETTGRTRRHGPVSATPTVGGATEEGTEPVDEEGSRSVITYGEPEANRLRVVKRGRLGVVLELTTAGFLAYPEPDGSVRIEIPDYVPVDDGGLPVKRTWVEALAGRQVELVSVREHGIETIGLRPAGASEHEIVAYGDGVVELRRQSRGRVKREVSSEAARVVSVGFQGELKKALVEMAPLGWDESRQQIRLVKTLLVTLSFAKRDRDDVVGPDGRLSRRRGKATPSRGEVVARLATVGPGLYAVSYEEVFGARYRRDVEAARLRLSRLGETVAYHLEPASSSFSPGSKLYFVSAGADANPYGKQAVYELEYPVSGGALMPVQNAAPSGAGASATYLRRDEHEENHLYQAALMETQERWMWDTLFAPEKKGYGFEVDALAGESEPSRLELWLQGGSDFPESPDHHVAVSVNGTPVGERSWNGKFPQKLDVELAPGVLQEGANLLEVDNVGDTGVAYSMVFVDRYAVTYPRLASANAGVLEGRWRESGTAQISGVSSRASLLDTTDAQPVWLAGAASSGDGVLRFRAEAEHHYLVVDSDRVAHPELRKASAVRWKSGSRQADYIVLGPRAFLDTARPLLDHRRRQGLTALAVPVEELYDEFGFGESRPEALRDFLSYAYHHWKAPSPRYVLLLGDATYDFKDYYGTGAENRVPPLMLETRFLWTVSDPTYAAVNGEDLLPDLAIGRLPAANVEEVRTMVEKILAYETGDASLGAPIVLVTDNPDQAGDFDADAEALAATVLASRAPERISLKEMGTAAARQAILDAFDDGASVVSYIGHGGIHLWANETLLDLSSVGALSPQPQQPLLLTMNCLNGYFHFPFFNSLSEELVKAEGKGAIAAFSPSGMSLNAPAHLYHEALLNALFHESHARLGDAILAAQEAYAETEAYPELLSIYHLLGDPALLRKR